LKRQPLHRRLGFALSGIKAAFQSESSFRTQLAFALIALGLLILVRPRPIWWALIALNVALVLAFELVNTALEAVVDRLHPERHPEIGKAKDCAAGAVLLISMASILMALAMFWDTYVQY
jgi:undecaprenol kinase